MAASTLRVLVSSLSGLLDFESMGFKTQIFQNIVSRVPVAWIGIGLDRNYLLHLDRMHSR